MTRAPITLLEVSLAADDAKRRYGNEGTTMVALRTIAQTCLMLIRSNPHGANHRLAAKQLAAWGYEQEIRSIYEGALP